MFRPAPLPPTWPESPKGGQARVQADAPSRPPGVTAYLAITKSSRTIREPSPMYFCTSSEPDTRMNVQSVWCATARASSVFPVPGGPYNRTPCPTSNQVSPLSR